MEGRSLVSRASEPLPAAVPRADVEDRRRQEHGPAVDRHDVRGDQDEERDQQHVEGHPPPQSAPPPPVSPNPAPASVNKPTSGAHP